jgi:hypothetical protein
LNTGLSIPPRFWNKKQEVVSDNLLGEHGSAGLINDEITDNYVFQKTLSGGQRATQKHRLVISLRRPTDPI